jgi:hypothetical protein
LNQDPKSTVKLCPRNLAEQDRRILSDFNHWFQFRRSMGQPGSVNIYIIWNCGWLCCRLDKWLS